MSIKKIIRRLSWVSAELSRDIDWNQPLVDWITDCVEKQYISYVTVKRPFFCYSVLVESY